MSALVLVGLNHRTAPVSVREALHFAPEHTPEALQTLLTGFSGRGAPTLASQARCAPAAIPSRDHGPAHSPAPTDAPQTEFVLLSTCNRTELYAYAEDQDAAELSDWLCAFLAGHAERPLNAIRPHLYIRTGLDAARHLLTVAAGLDSLVAGEDEILGQVKTAFGLAQSAGTCGPTLSALFRQALTCGKRARSQTGLGCLRRSVATVVVDLANELFPNLHSRTALLIGAGKISAMTARGLAAAGLRCILVANRTYDRAVKLAAAYGGQAVHFDALPEALAQADIVICSTGAPHIVLHAQQVQAALANRPVAALADGGETAGPGSAIPATILVVDLAVPRDADPAIADLPGVRLVDIDGLEAQARTHNPLAAEVRRCVEDIVAAETENFAAWLAERRNADLIRSLQAKADRICAEQVAKTHQRLGSQDPHDRQALEAMARAIAAQLLHAPIDYAKSSAGETEIGELYAEIFGL